MSSYWMSDDEKVSVKTFESYLRDALREGKIDHAIRVSEDGSGNIQFYIHPMNADGETLDYKTTNNSLWPAHPAFDKPEERLIMFLSHPDGKMFKADGMTWYMNMLERLRWAVEAEHFGQAKATVEAIKEQERELI